MSLAQWARTLAEESRYPRLSRATELGRPSLDEASARSELDACDDETVVAELRPVVSRMFPADGSNAWTTFLREEVWHDPLRAAFFCQGPLEALLRRLVDPVASPLADPRSGWVVDVLIDATKHGPAVDRVIASLAAALPNQLPHTPHVVGLCLVVVTAARHPSAMRCMADSEITAAFARRMVGDDDARAIAHMVVAAELHRDVNVARPIVEAAARRLVVEFVRVSNMPGEPDLDACLVLLERCAARTAWHTGLVQPVVALARHGWPPVFGQLLAELLATPSVELVLALHAARALDHLICTAHRLVESGHGPEWRSVRGRLRFVWPARVAEALELHEPAAPAATVQSCPITLHPMAHPVVASDGHTYERDAIMRHMTSGRPSPLTGVALLPYLYENFAVHSSEA